MLKQERRTTACCIIMQSDTVLKPVTAMSYGDAAVFDDFETHCKNS